MSWLEAHLGDYLDAGTMHVQTGPFGTQLGASDYALEGTPVVNVRNLGYGDLRAEKLEFVPDQVVSRLARHILAKRDIVFGRKGAVDRHLLVSESEAGWMQGSDCIRLRILTTEVNPAFLSFAFRLPAHKRWIIGQCSNKATMASLNQDVIARIPVRVPGSTIQESIASVLSTYDDLIENNRRRIRLLEQAARLLYREWFVHFRFPGHEHVRIVDGLPEGWERKPLSKIADIVMGQSPKSIYYNKDGSGLPFHQGVTNFGPRFPSHETYCTQENRLAEPGDILFSVRAPVGRINISRDRIVIGRGLAAIRSKRDRQNLLFYSLKSHFFKEDLIGTGAIFAAITKKELHDVEILQTGDQIEEMFMDLVRPIDLQIGTLLMTIDRLGQARDILLPRLMNGEIVV